MLLSIGRKTRHTARCGECGEDVIYEGDSYYIIRGETVCEECAEEIMKAEFEDMSAAEKAELFGYEREINVNPWED